MWRRSVLWPPPLDRRGSRQRPETQQNSKANYLLTLNNLHNDIEHMIKGLLTIDYISIVDVPFIVAASIAATCLKNIAVIHVSAAPV